MRLLAFSDIHHNLVAVRKLRAFEKNSFDAIIVAGDIGSKSADRFFEILVTFKCPIFYVYGNWDSDLGYKKSFGNECHLIHSNVITIGGISFTGFSGCPTHWGKNPIARKFNHQIECDRLRKTEILAMNQEAVRKALRKAKVDFDKCVLITHERSTYLSHYFPNLLLHIFGHRHKFSDSIYKRTRYVNVAALDRPISSRPVTAKKWSKEHCRNFNAGNYAVIEITASRQIKVDNRQLYHKYPNWIPLEKRIFHGIEWIPEESKWKSHLDLPLLQYEIWQS